VQKLALDTVVVPDALGRGIEGLAGLEVEASRVAGFVVLLQLHNDILQSIIFVLELERSFFFFFLKIAYLGIKAAVLCEDLGNDEEGVGKGNDPHLGLALDRVLELLQMDKGTDFKGTSTGDDRTVLDRVLDRSQTVTDGVLDLLNRVLVGALDEDRAREGVLDALDKRVLFFAKRVLVDKTGIAEDVGGEVVDSVNCSLFF